MAQTQSSATFMNVSDWKVLVGVQALNLSYNPDSDKFCLTLDNTRQHMRIDNALVLVNNADKTKSKIDKSQDMAIRIDEDCDPSDLDSICLVAVKQSALVNCDSI